MIVSDPEVGNFLAIYGPQLAAYVDTVYQSALQVNNQASQYADKGGDAGNADPGSGPNRPEFQENKYITEAQKGNPWAKYQQFVTGKDYEEVWQLANGRKVQLDAINDGYIVEAKWAGQNAAAWESSPLNKYFNATDTLDQLSRQIQFAQEQGLKGVRWAVSNEAGAKFFSDFAQQHFPDLYKSGFIQVWHVSGSGM